MDYKISEKERQGLYGLPHLMQLLYFRGIRPYMDFATGIVGLMRRISYQSLREAVYVEAHPGYKSTTPSKAQIRRALKGLERAGVIGLQSHGKTLQMQCLLASWDSCVQKKGVTKPSHEAIPTQAHQGLEKSRTRDSFSSPADPLETEKAVTPPVINNSYTLFLQQRFELFWEMYPLKQSKPKAWSVFQAINPSPALFETIRQALHAQCAFYQDQCQRGHWMPHWKYPANWLMQHGWEDDTVETVTTPHQGERHDRETHREKPRQKPRDPFWESCRHGLEPHTEYDTEYDTERDWLSHDSTEKKN